MINGIKGRPIQRDLEPWLIIKSLMTWSWTARSVNSVEWCLFKLFEQFIAGEVLSETVFGYALGEFEQEWQNEIALWLDKYSLSGFYFLRRGMIEQALNLFGKTPVLRDMFIMVVQVGKALMSIVWEERWGWGSRSQNVFDDWEMTFDTSSVTWEKPLRLVGVCRGGVRGDESVEEDFNAARSFWI